MGTLLVHAVRCRRIFPLVFGALVIYGLLRREEKENGRGEEPNEMLLSRTQGVSTGGYAGGKARSTWPIVTRKPIFCIIWL